MTRTKHGPAIQLLIESRILEKICESCNGKGADELNVEDGHQPCVDCNATGFRFYTLRRKCPMEHWAGNMPEDCHGVYYPLPPGPELIGLMVALPNFALLDNPGLEYLAAYWLTDGTLAYGSSEEPILALARALVSSVAQSE